MGDLRLERTVSPSPSTRTIHFLSEMGCTSLTGWSLTSLLSFFLMAEKLAVWTSMRRSPLTTSTT